MAERKVAAAKARPEPVAFKNGAAFRKWLAKHHATETEIVLRLFKKHAADQGMTYTAALDEALCHGWIDGHVRGIDADSYAHRFTPRLKRSIWSKINVAHVARLTAAGKMEESGLAAFALRDEMRTGVYSFEQKSAELSPAYNKRLKANKSAWKFFDNESEWYKHSASYWVMSAKLEATRERRLNLLIDSAARGERAPHFIGR